MRQGWPLILALLLFADFHTSWTSAQDDPPPSPPANPTTPPAATVTVGPFGWYRDDLPTWTEASATRWTNITMVRSGYGGDKFVVITSIEVGYDNGTVSNHVAPPTDRPANAPKFGPYTLDLTNKGEGNDPIVSMLGTILNSAFSAISAKTASGAAVSFGTPRAAANEFNPTSLVIFSPCPHGAYALTELSGTPSLQKLVTRWTLVRPELFDAIEPVDNPWICRPWLGFTRQSAKSPGQPECLRVEDSEECLAQACQIQQADGLCTFDDLPGANITTRACVPRKDTTARGTDYDDPTSYCSRAAGALELSLKVPTPFFCAFAILNVCNSGPAINMSVLEEVLYTHPYGLTNWFKDTSFGRAVFDKTTSVIKMIDIPCGVSKKTGLDAFKDWENHVKDKGLFTEAAKFSRIAFIGPCPSSSCNDYGQASVLIGGREVYLISDNRTSADGQLFLFKHELAHSLTIQHASKGKATRGDKSTPVGTCYSGKCSLAAPSLVQQLGWRNTVASLTGTTLPIGAANTYVLPALVDAVRSVLHVNLDWISGTTNVFVSLRVAKGQDSGIGEEFDQKISVHTSNRKDEIHSNRPGYLPMSDAPSTGSDLVAVLPVNGTWSQDGLTLRHVSFDKDSNTSVVKVCRYDASKSAPPPGDC